MFNLDTQIFLRDLIFPAVVAVLAAYFSYRGSYKLNENNQKKEERLRTIDLIDRMNLDLEKLTSVLDILKEDAEKLRFFSLANTRIARDLIVKLRGYFYSITLFKEDKLRKQIIETVDVVDSLINEMDIIETHILNERNKSDAKREELEKTYREIKIRLLEQDYYIDSAKGFIAKSIAGTKRSDKKPEIIKSIIDDLLNELKTSQDRVANLDAEYEKKRSFVVVKILDAQSKIRDLSNELTDQRIEI